MSKIGVFDSGLGGLLITKSFIDQLPEYDYLYLGDTARVPYGNRSEEAIYQFSRQALLYLFAHDCSLVIIACNTASAQALRRLQQEILPNYPGKKVLGVLIPATEEAVAKAKKKIGVLATVSTCKSGAYTVEIHKLNPRLTVIQQPAPLLVPLIENNGLQWTKPILASYLSPLREQNIDTLVLGCTHYPILKQEIRQQAGNHVTVISQDEFLPTKLRHYLQRHPEVDQQLTKNSTQTFLVTDKTDSTTELSTTLFGQPIKLEEMSYP